MTAESMMALHARSFAPAARLLAPPDRSRVARLYAVCRTVDDIADEVGGVIGRDRLQRLLLDLDRSQAGDPLATEVRTLFAGRPAGFRALSQLVAAAAADTGATQIADDAALDAYCMGVAGTVGVMMCALFDVDEKWHGVAADLGKAMQLTNICRDVAEDAQAGRRYLPFSHCPFPPEAIAAGAPDAIDAATVTMARLLDRADGLYQSGQSGLVALPFRVRLAVAAASSMYAGIGTELRHRNYAPLMG
ncbi:MAG: squalene/phytoene synthase family protein, partial [Pseudorhodobacter sp.]|nr:squalene/phytoene synthase family protein [Pseudorhodobacter sp.]